MALGEERACPPASGSSKLPASCCSTGRCSRRMEQISLSALVPAIP